MEEQFYLVWPALLLVLVLLARGARVGCRGRWCSRVLVVVTGASFVWSVVSTSSDPLAAYFSTPARAWELGLGALTALVAHVGGGAAVRRSSAGWSAGLGLVLIAVACVAYGDQTPFPGSAAAVPVVGSALVLLAGAGGAGRAAAAAGPRARRTADAGGGGLVVLAVPLALAGADHRRAPGGRPRLLAHRRLRGGGLRAVRADLPVRRAAVPQSRGGSRPGGRWRCTPPRSRSWPPAPWAATTTASTPRAPSATTRRSRWTNFGVKDPSKFDLADDPTVALVQASVIAARHHMAIPSELTPDILTVRDDEPDVGACDYEKDSRELCPRGDPDADRSIVVFGNSHARMWIPAFDEIGAELGYTHLLLREAQLRRLAGHRRRAGPRVAAVAGVRRLPRRGRSTRSPLWTRRWSSWPPAGRTRCCTTPTGNRIPKDGVDAAVEAGYVDLFTRLVHHRRPHRPAPRRTEVGGPARRVPHREGERPRRLPVQAAAGLGQRRRHLGRRRRRDGHRGRRPDAVDLLGRLLPRGDRRRAALPRPRPPHHRLRRVAGRRADRGAAALSTG